MLLGEGIRTASSSTSNLSPVVSPEMEEARSGRKRKSPENGIPTRVAGSYQRTKAGNACLICRARKTKCDNVWPVCGFCKKTGGECTYTQPSPQRFDQASIEILKRLDSLERAVSNQSHDCCARQLLEHFSPDQAGSFGSGVHRSQTSPHDVVSPALLGHVSNHSAHHGNLPILSTTSNRTSPGSGSKNYVASIQSLLDVPPGPDVMSRATEEMGIEAMLRWPVCKESLGQLGISTSVTLVEMLGQVSTHIAPATLGHDSQSFNRQTVLHLVENFLIHNNVKNPILDPVELRRDAEELLDSSYRHGGRFCRLLLVLAISSISISLTDHAPPGQVMIPRDAREFRSGDLYFQGAQHHMGALYCENSLISVQCAFLSGVYLMYTMRIMAAWKVFVQASTQCLGYFASRRRLGFSYEPHAENRTGAFENGDDTSANMRALEDSLYWSCLKSEIELRLELGLPGSGISGIQYPNIFPTVPSFDCSESSAQSGQSPSEADRGFLVNGWLFYLGEIALKRMQYRVLTYRYDHSDGSNAQEEDAADRNSALWQSVIEFDLQLQEWLRWLPPSMRFSPMSTEPLYDILPWVLRGHHIDVIEILRFPAISEILNNRHTNPSAAVPNLSSVSSEPTSQLSKEYLENAVRRIEANAEGLLHRHQGSWLTIRSCTRSALALLAMKLHYQSESHYGNNIPEDTRSYQSTPSPVSLRADSILPSRWRGAVTLVISMLKGWEPESPDIYQLRLVVEGLLGLCHV